MGGIGGRALSPKPCCPPSGPSNLTDLSSLHTLLYHVLCVHVGRHHGVEGFIMPWVAAASRSGLATAPSGM